jgi:hypothetical protein
MYYKYLLSVWGWLFFSFFFFFGLAVLRVELKAQHLLDKHCTTWVTPFLLLFSSVLCLFVCLFFQKGSGLSAQNRLRLYSSHFHLLNSWDYRHVPLCDSYFSLFKWCLGRQQSLILRKLSILILWFLKVNILICVTIITISSFITT